MQMIFQKQTHGLKEKLDDKHRQNFFSTLKRASAAL